MTRINGGELLTRTLADAGVTHAFGLHGGHLDALLVGMRKYGIEIIDTRHEAAAGHAAQAYSIATGKLGVAFCTSGPGFTNAVTAIANAHIDRTPVLFLTSSPPLREKELNVLQDGIDPTAMARTVTRWAHQATTVARVPDHAAQAIRRAQGGVPGPTVLDVPIDIMFGEIDESLASRPSSFSVPKSAPSRETLQAVYEELKRAERPVILVGAQASRAFGAREALDELLTLTSIPTAQTPGGSGLLDADSPYSLGSLATVGAMVASGEAPDLVILLGLRHGMMLGGRSGALIPHAARIIQIDPDIAEIGRVSDVAVGCVAGVAPFCQELSALLKQFADVDFTDWLRKAVGYRGAPTMAWANEPTMTDSGRMHPYFAAAEVWKAAGDNNVMVADGGESCTWVWEAFTGDSIGSNFSIGMLGALGIGTGFSIGAQIAHPDKTVFAVTGDGAMGFNIAEFDTMLRHNLPIITIVFNNLGWGMSFHGQDAIFGRSQRVAVDLPDRRYDQIAAGFGCYGERVIQLDEIIPAIERAKASGLPACIDLAIAPDVTHPSMAMLGMELPEGYTAIPYYEPVPAGER